MLTVLRKSYNANCFFLNWVIADALPEGIDEAKFRPMFEKKSLKALAIDFQSVNSVLFINILDGRLVFKFFRLIIFLIPLHIFLILVLLLLK